MGRREKKRRRREEKKRKERRERRQCGAGQDKVQCGEVGMGMWVWGCYMLNVPSNSVGLHLVLQAFA